MLSQKSQVFLYKSQVHPKGPRSPSFKSQVVPAFSIKSQVSQLIPGQSPRLSQVLGLLTWDLPGTGMSREYPGTPPWPGTNFGRGWCLFYTQPSISLEWSRMHVTVSQITSNSAICSTVSSGSHQRKAGMNTLYYWHFGETNNGQWIPLTNGQ